MVEAPLDSETVRAAQRGEGPARERLLHEAYRRVFRYLLRLCRGDREEAQELAQESIVRLLKSLDRLRDPDRLVPWFLRIASNAWRDSRSRRKILSLEAEPAAPESEGTDVLRHLSALPDLYRLPVTLRYVEGLDYESMSEALEIPVGTLKSQVARGLRMIRERMEGGTR